jgi:hypothetical protein
MAVAAICFFMAAIIATESLDLGFDFILNKIVDKLILHV